MKRNILILGSLTTDKGETAELRRYIKLFTAATTKDVKVSFAHFDDLVFAISPKSISVFDTRNQRDLKTYGLVVLRGKVRPYIDIAYSACRYLSLTGVPFFNNYLQYRSSSKLQQAITFYELKVPFPLTIYSKNHKLLRQAAEKEMKYPIIVKDAFGAHGKNNFLARNSKQLREILDKNPDVKFIIQEFVPNDSDYRFLIIGNQQVVIKRAASDGSHLNNTSMGATATLVDPKFLPRKVQKMARRIARHTLMTIAGVDVLYDEKTRKFYFLEINSQPQILTGAFTQEKKQAIGKYLDKLMR